MFLKQILFTKDANPHQRKRRRKMDYDEIQSDEKDCFKPDWKSPDDVISKTGRRIFLYSSMGIAKMKKHVWKLNNLFKFESRKFGTQMTERKNHRGFFETANT